MSPVPPWDPSMSDGCSALPIGPLRFRRQVNHWLFSQWPEAELGCERHDEAYHKGGTKTERLKSDTKLRAWWEKVGVTKARRQVGYRSIRAFGGPKWRTPGVSWANGGKRFKYDEEEA